MMFRKVISIIIFGLLVVGCSEQPRSDTGQEAMLLFVKDEMPLTGQTVQKMCVRESEGGIETILILNDKGRELLHDLTTKYLEEEFVFTDQNKIFFIARIRDPISSGRLSIFVERNYAKSKQDVEQLFQIQASEKC